MNFYEALNQSPWRGVIAEVGIGLEFSSRLLRVPGASNTVLQVVCDYAGLDRDRKLRAVSLENAAFMATSALDKARIGLLEHEDAGQRFGLAITGAHYADRPSHVYVYLATPNWDAYMHFSVATSPNREHVGRIVNDRVVWFLNACMLSTDPWISHIAEISDSLETHNIDILYAPGVSDVERLMLLKPNNPLVYHRGKFQRVTDYIRQYNVIYPGSFNPPTRVHLAAHDYCLFEITQKHCYKGAISIEDMLHRIRMIDSENQPVLITQLPLFVEKHDLLVEHGAEDFSFIMGADSWNVFTAAYQYPSETWLSERLPKVSFIVRPRAGYTIDGPNPVSKHLRMTVRREEVADNCSATDIRTASVPHEHPNLTPNVAKYIADHGLYRR